MHKPQLLHDWIISDGAEPLNSLQGGSASGAMHWMRPPTATGGNPRLPQQARRSRGRTTGETTSMLFRPQPTWSWWTFTLQMTKRCPLMLYLVGDFNSHSQSWGYDHIDKREKLAGWPEAEPDKQTWRPTNFLLQTMAHYIHTRPCILHRRLRWAN